MSDLPKRVGLYRHFSANDRDGNAQAGGEYPRIARELRDIAEQVQVEADSLAGCISE